ncbi:hypothetical protein FBU59_007246 [Linderina macrospora]|uniref:Uncharacterized protein n=1 Tax=Linderina macrospora TaxID=4868 RepID=A0ACC1IXT8_9FUNG|nr:hypothetical protein FBU59_007246 [Linderina macrospora]
MAPSCFGSAKGEQVVPRSSTVDPAATPPFSPPSFTSAYCLARAVAKSSIPSRLTSIIPGANHSRRLRLLTIIASSACGSIRNSST